MSIKRTIMHASLPTIAILLVATTPPPRASALGADGRRQVDVIVIGAGMSGLAAAKTLQEQHHSVLVLEARPRIGGRVWTDRSMGAIPLDLGASWIHGVTNNPIMALAKTFRLPTLGTDVANAMTYHFQRGRLSDDDVDAIDSRFQQALTEARQIAEQGQRQGKPDISVQAALAQTPTMRRAGDPQRVELAFGANTELEHEFAGAISDLSMLRYDEGATQYGGDVLFPSGFGQIPDRLAKGLDIRTGHRVTAVDYRGKGVVVATDKGSFTAAQAVVTLPLGVLKKGSVAFTPALPARKLEAIRNLGVGTLNKLYLRFPTVFWPKGTDWLGFVSPRTGEWTEFVNLSKATGQPILLAFNSADNGRQIESLSDAEQAAKAMETLRAMFGKSIPAPTAWLATRWATDPFAFGSYSYLAVGSTPQDREALGQPVGNRLFFAGEATSVSAPAMVHGAYLSGIAAAKKVHAVAAK